jgi:hypothetical protein
MFGRARDVYQRNPRRLRKKWPKDDAKATSIRVWRGSARRFKNVCRQHGLHPSRELTDFMKAWASGLYDVLPKFGDQCRALGLDPKKELEKLVGGWFKGLAKKFLRDSRAKDDMFRAGRKHFVSGGLPSLGKGQ